MTQSEDEQMPTQRDALENTFGPAVAYHEWERDSIWQNFLEKQKHFDRPRTQEVNTLMRTVPDGTRKEFLRRLQTANRSDNPVEFERHALGVAFAMQRLTLMMERRKSIMRLSSEPLRRKHLDGYMGYCDENTPPRVRSLTIVDNFTLFKDGEPFIYKAKYSPVRQFGEVDPLARDPHYDYNQMLKYNEAIEQGLICGAAIEIRGLISPDFLNWACGTSVLERSDIPHVQLIYNMPLPSGAEYRFTFKKASTISEELTIHNDMSIYTSEDMEVINGIENALNSGNQFQLTEIMSGQGVFREKGDLTKQFQSFSCPAREEELKDPAYYDNYLAMLRKGIWRRAASIKPETYNHNADTIFSPENSAIEDDYDALKKRIEAFQNALPRQTAYYLGDPTDDKYDARLVETISNAANRIRIMREHVDPACHDVPSGCYALSIATTIKDSIIETLLTEKGKTPKRHLPQDQQQERLSISRLLDTLDERKDIDVYDMLLFDPFIDGKNKQKRYGSIDADEVKMRKQTAIRDNLARFKKYYENGHCKTSERRALRRASKDIEALRLDIKECRKEYTDITSKRVRAAKGRKSELKQNILDKEKQLLRLLENCLEPSTQKQIFISTKTTTQNTLRFVYAIDRHNDIVLMEETKNQSRAKNRYNHSDLVKDGLIKGAGEILLEKPEGSQQWQIVEINNGSGHFRPPSDTLRLVADCFIDQLQKAYQARGMDKDTAERSMRDMMPKARLTDAIARGLPKAKLEENLQQLQRKAPKSAQRTPI